MSNVSNTRRRFDRVTMGIANHRKMISVAAAIFSIAGGVLLGFGVIQGNSPIIIVSLVLSALGVLCLALYAISCSKVKLHPMKEEKYLKQYSSDTDKKGIVLRAEEHMGKNAAKYMPLIGLSFFICSAVLGLSIALNNSILIGLAFMVEAITLALFIAVAISSAHIHKEEPPEISSNEVTTLLKTGSKDVSETNLAVDGEQANPILTADRLMESDKAKDNGVLPTDLLPNM